MLEVGEMTVYDPYLLPYTGLFVALGVIMFLWIWENRGEECWRRVR